MHLHEIIAHYRNLLRVIVEANPLFRPIPIALSRAGLRVWDSPL